jgi:hypothetical protein
VDSDSVQAWIQVCDILNIVFKVSTAWSSSDDHWSMILYIDLWLQLIQIHIVLFGIEFINSNSVAWGDRPLERWFTVANVPTKQVNTLTLKPISKWSRCGKLKVKSDWIVFWRESLYTYIHEHGNQRGLQGIDEINLKVLERKREGTRCGKNTRLLILCITDPRHKRWGSMKWDRTYNDWAVCI